MSAAVVRLKRKASYEPIDGLVLSLKKTKSAEELNPNEVYFKFAATVKSEEESLKSHIQAALSREKDSTFSKWRDLKSTAVNQKNVPNICAKAKSESKAASEKKRLDCFNNRRLIFTEALSFDDDDLHAQNPEVRDLFHLYDIIEENEEPKKQKAGVSDIITCNGTPLLREKTSDYVYDVYIADGQIDQSFVENTINLRPCTVTNDDICTDDSEDDSEIYEDEDDSNDENNWRNEYPEDEDSHSEKDSGDEYYDHTDGYRYYDLEHKLSHVNLEDDTDSSDVDSFNYSNVMDFIERESND